MTSRKNKLWNKASEEIRQAFGLGPISREEAEYENSLDRGAPLEESEIEAIVLFATGKQERLQQEVEPSVLQESFVEGSVREEILQLNRNAGELSDEIRERIERHRREVLEGDDEDDDEDGS